MSQFVIKNWAGDDGQVEVFDLRRWDTTREYPRSIMYIASDDEGRGIVPPEFGLARENDWKPIESKAAKALSDDPATLGVNPQRRQAVLDLMALHLVRSSEMLGVQAGVIAQGAARVLQEAQTGKKWGDFLEETGMSHEEAIRSVVATIRDPDRGPVASERRNVAKKLPEYLDRYRKLLQGCGLRLHRPKRSESFLLGDGPAFLAPTSRLGRETTALFGGINDVAQNVHLDGDEWCAWMPLTPRLLAVAGPRVLSCDGVRPLASQFVRQFNVEQCRRAQFRVVLPPDQVDRAREFVEQHAPPAAALVSAYPLQEAAPYEMWRR